MFVISALLWVLAIGMTLAVTVRGVFALAYLLGRLKRPETLEATTQRRFRVVVPAHDEELLIHDVIRSIRACTYPQDHVQIRVIADNCSDGTAARVRELGEDVLERSDPENRGKGHALAWYFGLHDDSDVDAIAIVDADNLVVDGFFREMNAQLEAGWNCLQAYDDLANPDETIMTRLLKITYVMKNQLYCAGKARLGRSILLMGTGMVFRRETLDRLGWGALSIGEDYEQAFNVVEAGEKIRFIENARVRAQESTTLDQAYVQRQRWMTGRFSLLSRAARALVRGFKTSNRDEVDISIDLLMPTYATLLNASLIAFVASLVFLPLTSTLTAIFAAVILYQALEVGIALVLMRAPWPFIQSLAFAPVFLAWRGFIDVLAAIGHRRDQWSRGARISHSTPEEAATPPRD